MAPTGDYRRQKFAACHAGLSIDLDHSCAAFFGSTSFVPSLCQAISATVVSTREELLAVT